MIPTPETLAAIVADGGAVVVDAATLAPDGLVKIAAACTGGGGLTVRHAHKLTPDTLKQVLAAAGGGVTFDFAS